MGARVRLARERAGLSQRDLATMIGVHHPNISDVERGRSGLTIPNLKRLAEVLGLSFLEPIPPDTRTAVAERDVAREELAALRAALLALAEGKAPPCEICETDRWRVRVITDDSDLANGPQRVAADDLVPVLCLSTSWTLAAGDPMQVERANIGNWVLFPRSAISDPDHTRALQVVGDSMTRRDRPGEGIPNRSVVAIDCRERDAGKLDGCLVAVSIPGVGAVVKQLRVTRTELRLLSWRDEKEIVLKRKDLDRNPIIGRVIAVISPAGRMIQE